MRARHPDRTPPRSRRGLALALVTIHATLLLSAWAVANRQTADIVRLKEHAGRSRTDHEPAARRLALAYAVALLETGVPEDDDADDATPTAHECYIDVATKTGDDLGPKWTYKISYTLDPNPGGNPPAPKEKHWTISVTLLPVFGVGPAERRHHHF
jgi:hypothetical protein